MATTIVQSMLSVQTITLEKTHQINHQNPTLVHLNAFTSRIRLNPTWGVDRDIVAPPVDLNQHTSSSADSSATICAIPTGNTPKNDVPTKCRSQADITAIDVDKMPPTQEATMIPKVPIERSSPDILNENIHNSSKTSAILKLTSKANRRRNSPNIKPPTHLVKARHTNQTPFQSNATCYTCIDSCNPLSKSTWFAPGDNQAEPHVASTTCEGCHEWIMERSYLSVGGRPWHLTCLHCNVCGRNLQWERTCYNHAGKIFCRKHYERMLHCRRCGDKFHELDIIYRLDLHMAYHRTCLACDVCSRVLIHGDAYVMHNGAIYCVAYTDTNGTKSLKRAFCWRQVIDSCSLTSVTTPTDFNVEMIAMSGLRRTSVKNEVSEPIRTCMSPLRVSTPFISPYNAVDAVHSELQMEVSSSVTNQPLNAIFIEPKLSPSFPMPVGCEFQPFDRSPLQPSDRQPPDIRITTSNTFANYDTTTVSLKVTNHNFQVNVPQGGMLETLVDENSVHGAVDMADSYMFPSQPMLESIEAYDQQYAQSHQETTELFSNEKNSERVFKVDQPGDRKLDGTPPNTARPTNKGKKNKDLGKSKRIRTSFSHQQLNVMKAYFGVSQNPDSKDLKQLSQATGLSKRVLQVWFQNARAKYRRSIGSPGSSMLSDREPSILYHVQIGTAKSDLSPVHTTAEPNTSTAAFTKLASPDLWKLPDSGDQSSGVNPFSSMQNSVYFTTLPSTNHTVTSSNHLHTVFTPDSVSGTSAGHNSAPSTSFESTSTTSPNSQLYPIDELSDPCLLFLPDFDATERLLNFSVTH
ncbi:hypothetical protein PHET_00926 [Paragonimus heterotremus]|uniref:Uncharacterized protein n=1 Tax=Paragonimus heterotremus TaxID=100268 RepID=A0A8J4WUY5_9TREM|nr:hypothetical protein PHET_00926 [Paragonimus heterotremus]